MRAGPHDTKLPVWDDKIGTDRPTGRSRQRADHLHMATTAPTVEDGQLGAGPAGAPRLRLLPKRTGDPARPTGPRRRAGRSRQGGTWRPAADARPLLLIAGGDAATRAQVHDELAGLMPTGTEFEELGTFWQLLARAPDSCAVILSGELDDVPAESLRHTLAERYPDLPVVSIGSVPSAGH